MVPHPLRAYLEANAVAYQVLPHSLRFTAQEAAATAHISGKKFAKVVLLRSGEGERRELLLAVLPASEIADLDRLTRMLGRNIDLADESEFDTLSPEYETGAVPPFGELAHLPVYLDRCLAEQDQIVFHGGTHTDLIEMRTDDFLRVAKPHIIDYGTMPVTHEPHWRAP